MQNLHYKHVFAWILVTIIHLTFLFSLTLIVNTPKPKHELKFEFVDVNGMYEKDDNAENLNTESIKNDNKYVSQPVIKENKSLPKKTEKKTKRTPPKKILSTEKKKSQFKTVEKKHKAKSIEKETSKKNNNNDIVTDPIPNNIASNNTVTEAKTDNSKNNKESNQNSNSKIVDQKPGYNKKIKPPYPLQARKMGIEGTVVLGANISETGKVENIKIIKSSGSSALDSSALNTYKKEKFIPRIENNIPQKSYIEFNVNFRLENYP